jgi:putative transposase
MRQSKFTETQIVAILKEADAGRPVNEIWRHYGISSATYYKWKAKYGGLEASDLKRLKIWSTKITASSVCTPISPWRIRR